MKKAILILVLALGMCVTSAGQQPSSVLSCSQSEVQRTAADVERTREMLLAIPPGNGMETDVSATAQKTVASMKDALATFIIAYMRCVPLQADTAMIRGDLFHLVNGFELPRGESISVEDLPANFGKFGFELYFDVRKVANAELLGVTANFSIECGGDTVLLIFSRNNKTWEPVIRWQKPPYATVDGGTQAFDYDISPPDSSGKWFLVTHDIAPWCSSTWSAIRYSVLRPTDDIAKPRVIYSASDTIWWGNDDYGTLKVSRNAFDLRFHSSSIDAGVHNRVWIRHYSVSGDTVTRTQPVAVSPRDFVDEWITSSWKQARLWSSTKEVGPLHHMHEAMSHRSESPHSLLAYATAFKCSAPNHYQVSIDEWLPPKFDKTAHVFYFQVVGPNPYTMASVSEHSDPTCTGRDVLEEMSTK